MKNLDFVYTDPSAGVVVSLPNDCHDPRVEGEGGTIKRAC